MAGGLPECFLWKEFSRREKKYIVCCPHLHWLCLTAAEIMIPAQMLGATHFSPCARYSRHYLKPWQQPLTLGFIIHILWVGKLRPRKGKLTVVGCTASRWWSQDGRLKSWCRFPTPRCGLSAAASLVMPSKEGSEGRGF